MSYTNGLDKPTDYFNTKLYTGTGSSQSITGVGFQPDWVWLKGRSVAYGHTLFDVIRGATKRIESHSTNAESTLSTGLTSFDSDGFTLGSSAAVNQNTDTFASWNWLAGGTASSNTDGSITSSVSANTTAGFSIVSYTGNATVSTIGHGLGVAPKVVIVKNRSNIHDWRMYHTSLGATHDIYLSSTGAKVDTTTTWNDTEPTSSVFTVGTANGTNQNGDSLIAYCFAEKKGYSKFGSYTGNGSTDGTFVYTGFKPALVIGKSTGRGEDWFMFDSTRSPTNVVDNYLAPNTSYAESSTLTTFDFLSNGFKLRTSGSYSNFSGDTLIYMAFASNPFVTSTGIPTCAR